MKLMVGLGNPGSEYANTRHNAGWLFLDYLVQELDKQIPNYKSQVPNKFQYQPKFQAEVCKVGDIFLIKPQTFMNRSGESVSSFINFYKLPLSQLTVIHDDLDLLLGEFKIQVGRGPKIHKGINSVEQVLNSKEFTRVRIGVDSRTNEERLNQTGRDYVLKPLTLSEIGTLEQVFERIVDKLLLP